MVSFPRYVDRNIVRSVAITTFVISLLIFFSLTGSFAMNIDILLIALFIDFILRYTHPKLSPNVYFHKLFNYKILKNEPKLSFSPPKRFAILIGAMFTGGMIMTKFVIIFPELFLVFNLFLLGASFLQAFYDYCLGCEIYNLLFRTGLKKQPDLLSSNDSRPVKIKNS